MVNLLRYISASTTGRDFFVCNFYICAIAELSYASKRVSSGRMQSAAVPMESQWAMLEGAGETVTLHG